MRRREATPETNNGVKLTIPVRTRTPLEAFQMLRQGQPIDVMAGYYVENGELEKDFFLMDKIEKHHKLAELKMREQQARKENLAIQQEYNVHQQHLKNEAEKQQGSTTTQTPLQGGTTV